jgi:hypothetical protein
MSKLIIVAESLESSLEDVLDEYTSLENGVYSNLASKLARANSRAVDYKRWVQQSRYADDYEIDAIVELIAVLDKANRKTRALMGLLFQKGSDKYGVLKRVFNRQDIALLRRIVAMNLPRIVESVSDEINESQVLAKRALDALNAIERDLVKSHMNGVSRRDIDSMIQSVQGVGVLDQGWQSQTSELAKVIKAGFVQERC